MTRFNKFVADKNTIPTANGNSHIKPEKPDSPEPVKSIPPPKKQEELKRSSDDEDDLSDVPDTPPPKKKRKAEPLDADAAFAAKLQAEENIRARPTRGGANRKNPVVKKKKRTPKKKTANKVKAEDDSDIDGSDVEEKKPIRSGGFHVRLLPSSVAEVEEASLTAHQKPLTLSAPLSALLDNEVQLSRPQTVKKIWEYIRKWDLQDPSDKRQIRCDEPMRAVFKQDKVHMFTLNKILNLNLFSPED